MKFKHVLLSLGLALTMGVGVATGIGAKEAKVAKAATSCSVRGSVYSIGLSGDWSTGQSVGNLSGSEYQWLNVTIYTVDSFKFVRDGSTWLGYGQLEAGCKGLFVSGDNLKVAESGIYDFYVKADAIWVSQDSTVPDLDLSHTYDLHGDRNDWGDGFGTFDDEEMTISCHLDAGEEFKIVGDGTEYFGYSSLSAPGSHFSEAAGGNIYVEVSGTYVFTLPDGFFESGSGVTFTITPDVADGPYLRGDWGDPLGDDWGWSEGGQLAMTGSGPYTVDDVPLSAGGEIKMVIYNDGLVTWTQPSASSKGTGDFPYDRTGEGGNVSVEKDGLYDVTVTLVSGTTYTYTLVGRADADLTAATNFATAFVSDMYANCPYNYSTSGYNDGKSSSTIASTWGAKVTAYAALSAKAKNYLSTEAGNSVAAITTMWTSYDYVYGHYASVRAVVGADFLGRDPAIVASFSIEGLNQVSNSPETIIIVVISATTLVAVGGFFLLRKKREN